MAAKKKQAVMYHGTGRRKSSTARVYLTPGTGDITVNGKSLDDYLPLETQRMLVRSPFETTDTLGTFNVNVNVQGGGYTGQSGAIRHGISRALLVLVQTIVQLKSCWFLDSRSKTKRT
jgi:small subunit ribosomal protein S9